jgi:hypothetical protein
MHSNGLLIGGGTTIHMHEIKVLTRAGKKIDLSLAAPMSCRNVDPHVMHDPT